MGFGFAELEEEKRPPTGSVSSCDKVVETLEGFEWPRRFVPRLGVPLLLFFELSVILVIFYGWFKKLRRLRLNGTKCKIIDSNSTCWPVKFFKNDAVLRMTQKVLFQDIF